jgi:hypothetical protein
MRKSGKQQLASLPSAFSVSTFVMLNVDILIVALPYKKHLMYEAMRLWGHWAIGQWGYGAMGPLGY